MRGLSYRMQQRLKCTRATRVTAVALWFVGFTLVTGCSKSGDSSSQATASPMATVAPLSPGAAAQATEPPEPSASTRPPGVAAPGSHDEQAVIHTVFAGAGPGVTVYLNGKLAGDYQADGIFDVSGMLHAGLNRMRVIFKGDTGGIIYIAYAKHANDFRTLTSVQKIGSGPADQTVRFNVK